jgi:hypothetical protein
VPLTLIFSVISFFADIPSVNSKYREPINSQPSSVTYFGFVLNV